MLHMLVPEWVCWLSMGILAGQLFVHYVEHQLRKKKYSYVRYFATVFSILFLVWLVAKIGGFEKRYWMLDLFPIAFMVIGIFLSVKIVSKKRGASLPGK